MADEQPLSQIATAIEEDYSTRSEIMSDNALFMT